MLAIRRASSFVSNLAADRRPGGSNSRAAWMDGPACLFDESGQLKTDRQMAAARAEQSEQRERDECEFHLVPLAAGQRRLKDEPTCTGPLQY